MIEKFGSVLLLCFLFVFVAWKQVSADEVWLSNGDRISGKLISLKDGTLSFKTSYAGELSINWEEVTNLKTDEPIEVVLGEESKIEGIVAPEEDGKITIKTEPAAIPITIKLSSFKTISLEEKPSVRITARANVGIIQESGNSETDNIRIDADFIARTEKSRYGIGGEFNREKSEEITTVRNWKTYGNYDYYFWPKWFWYALGIFEHDEFQDLDLRSTLGTGIGHQVFESDPLNLSFLAGPAYVDENFISAPNDSYSAAQLVVRYDQYFFDKFFQLFHDSNSHVSLEDSNNWVINTRQGVRFPIYKGITGTLQYNYDYDNEPSPDAKADYDSKFSFLLGYEFKN